MPEMHNHQQQSPEVKQQPGNKTIKTAEGNTGGIPRLTLCPLPHSTSVPPLSTGLSGPFKSHPDYRRVTRGTILKVSTASLSHLTGCDIHVTSSSNYCTQLLLNCWEITMCPNTKKTIYLLSRYTCQIPKENKHIVFSLIYTAVMNNQI